MKINANEIDSIEEAGEMNSAPVKMIRTKGGLWIAVGRPRGKAHDEALAAGSHPAIVKYNMEKKYPDYQPSLMKSESLTPAPKVMQHSHFLSEDLRKSGYDIHSMETATGVEFILSQHGADRGFVKAAKKNQDLHFYTASSIPSEALQAMQKAFAEKALDGKFAKLFFGVK